MNTIRRRNTMVEFEQRERELQRERAREAYGFELVEWLVTLYIKPILILTFKTIVVLIMTAAFILASPQIIDSILETYDR